MSAIVTLIGGWRATAFLAFALAALAFAGAQTMQLSGARADLATIKSDVANANAAAQAAARAESEHRDAASSSATQTMTDTLGISLPAIEATSYAAIERVRTIYRDRPVAVACQRPDSVHAELDQARARANGTAARGLPAQPAGASTTDPAAVADGRVGASSHGDRRSGAVEVAGGTSLSRIVARAESDSLSAVHAVNGQGAP